MPTRERLLDVGTQRGIRLVRELADEIRRARHAAGLSQVDVGTAANVSGSTISRMERGLSPLPDLVTAARVARIVGLDLSVKCFPAAGPLRDVAHLRLLQRFLAQVPASVARRLETPIRLPGDQRAWDVLLVAQGRRVGVAAETRIRDLQALLRREQAKARDDGVDVLILVVAATRSNRRALRDAGTLLETELPLDTRQTMAALRRGQAPTAGGIVVV
jgi:transcriptional regulator with XRE-family HTH domain